MQAAKGSKKTTAPPPCHENSSSGPAGTLLVVLNKPHVCCIRQPQRLSCPPSTQELA